MRDFATAFVWTLLLLGLFGCMAGMNDDATNGNLPLVQAAAPKHGFVCVPAITPRLGPVRSKELV